MDRQTLVSIAQNNPEIVRQGQEQWQGMLSRSATDAAFRSKLLTDPRAAIAEHTGRSIEQVPALNVVFIENKADATIVLPEPVSSATELSEQELEAVAGGSEVVMLTIGAAIAVVTIVDACVDAYQAGKKMAN
jgi:hypothetical protein